MGCTCLREESHVGDVAQQDLSLFIHCGNRAGRRSASACVCSMQAVLATLPVSLQCVGTCLRLEI